MNDRSALRPRLLAALGAALLLTSCSSADGDDHRTPDGRTSRWGKALGAPEASAFMQLEVPKSATEVKGAVQINPQEDIYLLSFVTDEKTAVRVAEDLRPEKPLRARNETPPRPARSSSDISASPSLRARRASVGPESARPAWETAAGPRSSGSRSTSSNWMPAQPGCICRRSDRSGDAWAASEPGTWRPARVSLLVFATRTSIPAAGHCHFPAVRGHASGFERIDLARGPVTADEHRHRHEDSVRCPSARPRPRLAGRRRRHP